MEIEKLTEGKLITSLGTVERLVRGKLLKAFAELDSNTFGVCLT